MSKNYYRQGEIAQMDKVDGNERPSNKNSPYELTISYDCSGEFSTRITVLRKDYFFRALTIPALRNQVKQTFPNLRVSFTLGRSARLASDPREILRS